MDITIEGNVTLSKSEAKCLASYSSDDDTRPHLAGVVVEPGKVRCWATDGHRAVMVRKVGGVGQYVPNGAPPPMLIPRDALESAVRMCRKGTDTITVWMGGRGGSDGGLTLGAGERHVALQAVAVEGTVRGTVNAVAPDVEPPPIDQVLYVPERPTRPGAPVIGVSASLLADVTLIAKAAAKPGVNILPGEDALAPIGVRTTADTADEWTAVIMPMRLDGTDGEVSVDDAVEWAAQRAHKAGHGDRAAALVAAWSGEAAEGPALPAKSPPKRAKRSRKGAK
jgi:hypothetical protein